MVCEHYSCAPYNPDQETVVVVVPALHKTRNNAIQKAGVLLRALPVQMITDLQRRLAPRKLHEATHDDVTDNLCASYSTKKSIIGASVHFFSCKQKTGESIEDFCRELKHLVSQCDYKQTITLDQICEMFLSLVYGLDLSCLL